MSIVAVDALGGDFAPDAIVAGALDAARAGIEVTLVGPDDVLSAALARVADAAALPVRVSHAPDGVEMGEAPITALRRKPKASIKVAAELVAQGFAQAVFSAGHTGAAFMAAHGAMGLLPGVERPALAVTIPVRGGFAVLLDAGANADCRPSHLRQFAAMGAAFAHVALGRSRARVALLSIGEEPGKGNELTRGAHELISRAWAASSPSVEYLGNIDARAMFSGDVDVIVCDGFTGNVALKVGEGLAEHLQHALAEELGASGASGMVREALARLKKRVDYAEQGAAPLLGVGGLMLVGHGRSTAKAVTSGIIMAARLAEAGLIQRLTESLAITETEIA